MKTSRKWLLATVVAALSTPLLVGCGEDVQSKNMEQLYAEQGVPVRTETVTSTAYAKGLEYNAVITGARESSAFASLSDKIDKINYAVGDFVSKDAVVMSFPTDNPKAQYFQSKLTYENAAATFERMKSYYETGGLSRQEFENAETSYQIAEANWQAVAKSVEVRAPIAGLLTRISVQPTENVDKDAELFTVARVDKVKARLWVADSDIGGIRVNQAATAEWMGHSITGRVTQVDLSMNQACKAFAVDVLFDNSEGNMRTGVTASVTLETYRSESAIFIERKNIIREDTGEYVFLNKAGTARKQVVQTGMISGVDVEIVSGLNQGDELIVEGQMLLAENTKLNLITN